MKPNGSQCRNYTDDHADPEANRKEGQMHTIQIALTLLTLGTMTAPAEANAGDEMHNESRAETRKRTPGYDMWYELEVGTRNKRGEWREEIHDIAWFPESGQHRSSPEIPTDGLGNQILLAFWDVRRWDGVSHTLFRENNRWKIMRRESFGERKDAYHAPNRSDALRWARDDMDKWAHATRRHRRLSEKRKESANSTMGREQVRRIHFSVTLGMSAERRRRWTRPDR